MASFICFWIRMKIYRVKTLERCHAIRWCPNILWGITLAKTLVKEFNFSKVEGLQQKLPHKYFSRFLITSVVQLCCRKLFDGWFYSILQLFKYQCLNHGFSCCFNIWFLNHFSLKQKIFPCFSGFKPATMSNEQFS